jgi:long-chain acyl-CoA synthetase
MPNLADRLAAAAATAPDRVAVKCDDAEFTYAALDDASARLAAVLHGRGVRAGDRIGLMLPNTPVFPIAFYAVVRLGAVVVPMNPLLKGREVQYYLSNTSARMLLATTTFTQAADEGSAGADAACLYVDDATLPALLDGVAPLGPPVPRDNEDTAVILHTSGTTGKPKGAELSHGGLDRNADVTATTLIHLGPDDVIMGCLPLFHAFGLTCGLLCSVTARAMLTLLPRFDASQVLDIIQRDGVTVFEGVPTMYSALLAADDGKRRVDSLRACTSGGAAMPVQVIHDFEQAFGTKVLEGYGLSETSPVACFNHPNRPRKPGTIGTPIDGVEMRVVDLEGRPVPQGEPGEIQIRGHNVMKGYWNLPDATAAAISPDGWFATGDIGKIDEDGYFSIVDRKKELIIRGGMNVYPRELEEVFYEHATVAAAAVIGIPHETLGEEVGAAIELKPDVSATAEELRDYVKERVAAYKYPRRVWIVDELPKGPTGKLQKRDITIPEEHRK